MIIQHLFIGALCVVAGVLGLKYNYQIVGFTGNVGFAERYLGGGGTYAFFKILSVLLCIGGFMYMFGLFEPMLEWLLSPLAGYFKGITRE